MSSSSPRNPAADLGSGSVPRGTPSLPPAPEWSRQRWPSAFDDLQRYAHWLAGAGVQRGLLGPRETPRLWERHILNCAVAVDVAAQNSSVVDIGSGAGLPGMVWALVRPDLTLTLVEPLQRRADFLNEVVSDLQIADRVHVRRARAEELAGEVVADVVTARAVAPWSRLASWCLPLVSAGGVVAALKGASARAELRGASEDLTRAGAGEVTLELFGAEVLDPPTVVVLVRPRAPGPPTVRMTARRRDMPT